MSIQTSPLTGLQPIPVTITTVARPSIGAVIARHVMPVVASTAATALATLAAERALAGFALRAIERTGFAHHETVPTTFTRVIETRTTIIEQVSRR